MRRVSGMLSPSGSHHEAGICPPTKYRNKSSGSLFFPGKSTQPLRFCPGLPTAMCFVFRSLLLLAHFFLVQKKSWQTQKKTTPWLQRRGGGSSKPVRVCFAQRNVGGDLLSLAGGIFAFTFPKSKDHLMKK